MPVTISGTGSITGARLNKKIAAFTSSGTWTVPAGVTYAIAHMLGGGGGLGTNAGAGTAGGDSSVAFASGTVTAKGGLGGGTGGQAFTANYIVAGAANTGKGVRGNNAAVYTEAGDSEYATAGADVTPGASITVTVGSGGTTQGGTALGGSGYVYIEYYAD